jgi:hypothetical protein
MAEEALHVHMPHKRAWRFYFTAKGYRLIARVAAYLHSFGVSPNEI